MSHHDGDLSQLADHVVALVGNRAAAQVAASRQRHGLTRFANSFVHQHVGEDTRSVTLKVAVDGRVAAASTSDLARDALSDFVDATIAMAELQPPDQWWAGVTEPADVTLDDHTDAATGKTAPDARAELVKAFVDAGPGLRAAGYVDTEFSAVAFANTAGHRASGRASRATVDGIHQTATSAGSAHQTSIRFNDLDAAAAGHRAAERARASETFVDLDPGVYEVVLGPEAVGTIATFLSLYGFSAKAHQEEQSFARLGEQQFDPAFVLTDDITDARSVGLPFDADGTPKRRTPLVADGVTTNLVHDRRTAKRAGATSTGNALPGSEVYGPIASNLVVAGGSTAPDDLVTSVERGLLVTQFHYCRILDPKTQVVTGLTRNGTFLIEDGKVAGAVGNLRFTQSFVEALGPGQVIDVGDDDRLADTEWGPGFAIAPSLRLAGWNFTGGARG